MVVLQVIKLGIIIVWSNKFTSGSVSEETGSRSVDGLNTHVNLAPSRQPSALAVLGGQQRTALWWDARHLHGSWLLASAQPSSSRCGHRGGEASEWVLSLCLRLSNKYHYVLLQKYFNECPCFWYRRVCNNLSNTLMWMCFLWVWFVLLSSSGGRMASWLTLTDELWQVCPCRKCSTPQL